jgi:hypothetical protein
MTPREQPKYLAGRLAVFLALVAVPSSALADAGTPLMWVGALHLAMGNLIIGAAEGLILAKLFSLKKLKCVWLLIPANYFSAWVGYFFLEPPLFRFLHMDLNNGWTWFWVLVFVTYLMTLVLEWPFVALCFRGSPGWLKRSLKGNFVVQTISYVVLFGWYWAASGTSLYTQMRVVSPKEISLPESVVLYFIAESDGNISARLLASGESREIFNLRSTNKEDRLFVRPSRGRSNYFDLVARLESGAYHDTHLVEIERGFAKQAVLDWHATLDPPQNEGTWFNFGPVPRLGAAAKSDWNFETDFWPIEGFFGENKAKGARIHFSFETPFGAWAARNATQLPGDKVVFQLGENQICVMDPNAKTIALLVHGRGPVAAIPDDNLGQTVPKAR